MERKEQRIREQQVLFPGAGWNGKLVGTAIKLITIGVILYVIIFL